MRWFVLAVSVVALISSACERSDDIVSDNNVNPSEYRLLQARIASDSLLACETFADFTVTGEIDPGVVHNAILTQMGAAAYSPGQLTYDQWSGALIIAANKVYEQYGAARQFTEYDVNVTVHLARDYAYMYDLRGEDPDRSDPMAVVEYLRNRGALSSQDVEQLRPLFEVTTVEDALAAGANLACNSEEPVSDVVAATLSVYLASAEYWSGSEYGSNRLGQTLGAIWCDALGGMLANALGVTSIVSPLVAAAFSTVFAVAANDPGVCLYHYCIPILP